MFVRMNEGLVLCKVIYKQDILNVHLPFSNKVDSGLFVDSTIFQCTLINFSACMRSYDLSLFLHSFLLYLMLFIVLIPRSDIRLLRSASCTREGFVDLIGSQWKFSYS